MNKTATTNIFLFLLAATFILGFFLKAFYLGKTVYGDGIYYYSYLHSLVVDHDVDFSNEYAYFSVDQPLTSEGRKANVYAIGPALFWLPSYLAAHTVWQGDGFSLPYQLTVGTTSVLFAITGLLLLFRLLTQSFLPLVSLTATLGIGLATNLLFYGSLDPVNSHALSFFWAVVATTLIVQKNHLAAIGASIGLLALIRSQDSLFLVLAIPRLLSASPFKKSKVLLDNLFSLFFPFFLAFFPQLIIWQILYGTFWKSPYLDAAHTFDVYTPHIFDVLLSHNNGLFLWTPIVAYAANGFFLRSFPNAIPRWNFLSLLLLQLYLVASWSFWWQGASFSGRMFISVLPLLATGLASQVSKVSAKKQFVVVGSFILLNICLIVMYLITH